MPDHNPPAIPIHALVSAIYAPHPHARVPAPLIPFLGLRTSWLAVEPIPPPAWFPGEPAVGGPPGMGTGDPSARAFVLIGGGDGAELMGVLCGGTVPGVPDVFVSGRDVVGVRVMDRSDGT